MANFEVRVNSREFEKVGVKPTFDENLYGDLLDTFAPNTQGLVVRITPHLSWGRSFLGQIGMALTRREEFELAGVYSEEDKSIDVYCDPEVQKTNNTLLHETKHYIDHTTGELEIGTRAMRRSMNTVIGTAAAGGIAISGVAFTAGGEPMIGALVVVPTLPMLLRSYWKSPHEIAAREFSSQPEIFNAYGKIIQYTQVN